MKKLWLLVFLAACGGGGGDDADAAAGVDGASADSVTTADAPPGGGGSLVEEAILTCAWTTGCLNPEGSFGGGAPNTNMSSCIATFMDQRAQPMLPEAAPWAQYRACTATATDCGTFAACLEANHAICGTAGAWHKGFECPDGSRSCDPSCLATCTGDAIACDGDTITQCSGGTEVVAACDGGVCVEFGGGANCLPGTTGTCTTDGLTCDGTTQVVCFTGIENRFDCATAGQTCDAATGRCTDGDTCTFEHEDTCTGAVLTACASGNEVTFDCASIGATCGTTTAGRAGCVFE